MKPGERYNWAPVGDKERKALKEQRSRSAARFRVMSDNELIDEYNKQKYIKAFNPFRGEILIAMIHEMKSRFDCSVLESGIAFSFGHEIKVTDKIVQII